METLYGGWRPVVKRTKRENPNGTITYVSKVVDWLGSGNGKPSSDIYIGDEVFTSNIWDAVPFRLDKLWYCTIIMDGEYEPKS